MNIVRLLIGIVVAHLTLCADLVRATDPALESSGDALEVCGFSVTIDSVTIQQSIKRQFEYKAAAKSRLLVVKLKPTKETRYAITRTTLEIPNCRLFSESGAPIKARMTLLAPRGYFDEPITKPMVEAEVEFEQRGPLLKNGKLQTLVFFAPIDMKCREVIVKSGDKIVFRVRLDEAEKAAEPGATDNPDDAQRLREDH